MSEEEIRLEAIKLAHKVVFKEDYMRTVLPRELDTLQVKVTNVADFIVEYIKGENKWLKERR